MRRNVKALCLSMCVVAYPLSLRAEENRCLTKYRNSRETYLKLLSEESELKQQQLDGRSLVLVSGGLGAVCSGAMIAKKSVVGVGVCVVLSGLSGLWGYVEGSTAEGQLDEFYQAESDYRVYQAYSDYVDGRIEDSEAIDQLTGDLEDLADSEGTVDKDDVMLELQAQMESGDLCGGKKDKLPSYDEVLDQIRASLAD